MNEQWSFAGNHQHAPAGTIYLVPTPIGNLEDMSFRAVKVLKEAAVIAAEDTRHTRKLLTHFDIHPTELVSYHEHNRFSAGPKLIEAALAGKNVALVSDAGMPGIADPGYDLVRLAVDAGLAVIPLPGPNAALTALITSGQMTQPFSFFGFLPRENKPAKAMLDQCKRLSDMTLIFYEAPHRVRQTIERLLEVLGNRPATAARELTKKHEHFLRGTLEELAGYFKANEPRGEFVLIIGPSDPELQSVNDADQNDADDHAGNWWSALTLEAHVERYTAKGMAAKEAMRLAAKDRGLRKRDVYQALVVNGDPDNSD